MGGRTRPRAALGVLGALLVAGAVVLPAVPASAQVGERIRRYGVDVEVRPDGRLHVVETIAYDFGFTPRHGIFRTIPYKYRYDRDRDRVMPVENVRVTASANTPTKTKVSRGASNVVIRVGDENVTITGAHTYVLTYDVRGAVNRFEDHDELYWNAVGAEWAVPIDDASVTVHADASVGETACFTGPKGSALACATRNATGRRAAFGQRRMLPYSALTVVVALPRGYAATPGPLLVEHRSLDKAFSRSRIALALAGLVLLLGLGWLYWLLSGRARDRMFAGEIPGLEPPAGTQGVEQRVPVFGRGEGPIEYRPDDTMRPALMGVLLDEKADPLDVTATIVDLAVRGHLSIDELPREGLFRRRDWRLNRLAPPAGDLLTSWEVKVMSGLFPSGSVTTVSALKKAFHPHLVAVQESLYDDVVERGWFTVRPDEDRGRWASRGLVVALAGGGLTYVLARYTHLGLVGLPVVVTGLLLVALHGRMPFRTARGSAALVRALGFKRYLATAEAEQLRFEEREGIFARYLPYAIVLGETERWAKVFHDLGADQAKNLTWYSGPNGWSAADFTHSFGAFTTATSGTLSATPGSSGSSGFSGGGSSGGGGGGGGGGSW